MSNENYVSYDLNWGMTGNMANDWPNRYCNETTGCVPRNYHGLVHEGYKPPTNTYGRENCCGGSGGYQPLPLRSQMKKRRNQLPSYNEGFNGTSNSFALLYRADVASAYPSS